MTLRTLAATVAAIALTATSLTNAMRLSSTEIDNIRGTVPTCDRNVCFAFEGSNMLSAMEFQSQIDFILDVTAVIGDRAGEFDAVQFAASTIGVGGPFSSGTELASSLQGVMQNNGTGVIAIGGINVCFSSLNQDPSVGSMIFLGTGNTNIGGDPAARANLFRSVGGEVLAVAVGNSNDAALNAIAGGDADNVFNVDGDLRAEIEDIVLEICDVDVAGPQSPVSPPESPTDAPTEQITPGENGQSPSEENEEPPSEQVTPGDNEQSPIDPQVTPEDSQESSNEPDTEPLPPIAEGLTRLSRTEIDEIRSALQSTCDSSVCFAFEGSNMLNAMEFQSQIDFIFDVTSIIGGISSPLSAVQFAASTDVAAPASENATEFVSNLQGVVQNNGTAVFATGGLNACLSRVANDPRSSIVFLGTGNNNIGSSPGDRADDARNLGVQILTVAVGNANDDELNAIAGGITSNMFDVGSVDDQSVREEVEGIVMQICSTDASNSRAGSASGNDSENFAKKESISLIVATLTLALTIFA